MRFKKRNQTKIKKIVMNCCIKKYRQNLESNVKYLLPHTVCADQESESSLAAGLGSLSCAASSEGPTGGWRMHV